MMIEDKSLSTYMNKWQSLFGCISLLIFHYLTNFTNLTKFRQVLKKRTCPWDVMLHFGLFLYENVNKLIVTSNKTITNNFVLNAMK